ncbi:MAG: hypothetical protein KF800_14460 [Lysobacter sp.]|nr:hypothetical protein [Lysobacter sp.]
MVILSILLFLGQAASDSLGEEKQSGYENREMASYVIQGAAAYAGCIRKFRRLNIERMSIGIKLDLDDDGRVSTARIESPGSNIDLEQCILDWAKRFKFKVGSPKRGVYVATLINADLMAPPVRYIQDDSSDAAVIENWKSPVNLCKVTGLRGPGSKRACHAYVATINGHVANVFAGSNRVKPGRRMIGLSCSIQEFTGRDFPEMLIHPHNHVYEIEAGREYRLHPRWDGDVCIVDMVDVETGRRIEKHPIVPNGTDSQSKGRKAKNRGQSRVSRCPPLSSQHRTVLGASRSRRVAAQTLTRLRAMQCGFANGVHSGRRAKRSAVMSKPKPQFQPSNVLLVEVPPQFIALCEASGASPQAALRGMAAMLCGLQYDTDNRLVPLDGPTA